MKDPKASGMKVRRARATTCVASIHPSSFILGIAKLGSRLHVRPTPRSAACCCGRPCRRWTLAAGLDRAGLVGAAGAAARNCRRWRLIRRHGAPARFVLLIAWVLWFAGWMAAVAVWNELGIRGILGGGTGHLAGGVWPAAWRRPDRWRRRPYCTLWLVGFVFWLAALHWLRLPHWATCFGWLALSFYFAFYLPLFVGLSRVAVHRLRVPVIVAAPVVWTGLELARAHVLTGMTMASLGHTQYRWIALIQMSDLARGLRRELPGDVRGRLPGADGALRRHALGRSGRWRRRPPSLAAALVYGHFRTRPADDTAARRPGRPDPRLDRHADEVRPEHAEARFRALLATGRKRRSSEYRKGRPDRLAGNHVPLAVDHLRRRLRASRQISPSCRPPKFRKRLEKGRAELP